MHTHAAPSQPVPGKMYLETPSEAKRGFEFVRSIAGGALAGYIGYWITRAVVKLFSIDAGVINPVAYILSGIISAAIVETARLSHDAALAVLGKREKYEDLAHPEEVSTFDRLRQHSWKVIKRVEDYRDATDVVFSRICGMRTMKAIQKENIRDRELYSREIIRRAFVEQVKETITTGIPQELSLYAIEAMGYTILGGHLFLWLQGLLFYNGVMMKMSQIHAKITEENKEIKRRVKERLAAEARAREELAAKEAEGKVA